MEGNWIGLYSYLGWADFEALRDNTYMSERAGYLCNEMLDWLSTSLISRSSATERSHHRNRASQGENVILQRS